MKVPALLMASVLVASLNAFAQVDSGSGPGNNGTPSDNCKVFVNAENEFRYRLFDEKVRRVYEAPSFNTEDKYYEFEDSLISLGCDLVNSPDDANYVINMMVASWYPNEQTNHGTEGIATVSHNGKIVHRLRKTASGKFLSPVGTTSATPRSDKKVKETLLKEVLKVMKESMK